MHRKEEILQAFGRTLATIRKEKKLSIRELAAAAGMKALQVKNIEAGKVNLLFTSIISLSNALGVSPEELLQSLDPD